MKKMEKILKMGRKKWLIVIGALVLVGVGGRGIYQHFFSSTVEGDDYVSNDMPVTKGDVVNALTMNGRAKFSNMQKLIFPQNGKITEVYKKVGDLVKAGETIARMDSYEVDNELESAKIDLENEQRNLEKAQDTTKIELQIAEADKKYQALLFEQKNASTSLKLAIQTIENEYTNKKLEYETLLSDLVKKQKEYDTKKKTYDEVIALDKGSSILNGEEALKNMVESLKYSADAIIKEMDALDKVMRYTTKYGSSYDKPEYLIYLGAKDWNTKTAVERLYNEIIFLVTPIYNWASDGNSLNLTEVNLKSQLIQQYEEMKSIADKKSELNSAITVMMNATIESVNITIPTITVSDGRSLKTEANKAIDEILGLASPETIGEKRKKELDDLKLEIDKMEQDISKKKIESSQIEVEKAQKIADATKDSEMKELQARVAKKELDDLKAGEDDQVKLIKNNIKQKQKQIETIMKKYDNYFLKANFDGVITKMTIQVGDMVGNSSNSSSSNEERAVYIENPDNLEIQIDVDQSDITKLTAGMTVQIELDALPDSEYTGILAEIDTTAGDDGGFDGGATNYKAKIVFTKKAEDMILGSMTATVTIVLQEVHDVLVVPNMAVSNEMEGNFVMKIENGKYKKVAVEIGITDQANTEIISGISEGDTIMGVFIDKEGMDAAGLNDKQNADGEGGVKVAY